MAVRGMHKPVTVTSHSVPSGVSEQPYSDRETRRGAENRASAALAADPKAIIGIGLEGGVAHVNGELWSTVWCCVADRSGNRCTANGVRFKIPEKISEKLREGTELGPIMDSFMNDKNTKKKQGMVGIVTNKFVSRSDAYASVVKLALGLWLGKDWDKAVT